MEREKYTGGIADSAFDFDNRNVILIHFPIWIDVMCHLFQAVIISTCIIPGLKCERPISAYDEKLFLSQ